MYRFLIIINIFFLFSIAGYSQQIKGNFFVTGKVKVDQGVVDGIHIEVYRNSVRVQDVVVNRTGTFRMAIDLGQLFRFNFKSEQYYSKTVEIDTHIPPDACKVDCNFPPYQLSLLLYKKVPGVSETSQQPGKISYNPKIDNFDAEILRQTTNMEAMIDEALNEVKQKSILYDQQFVRDKKQKYDKAINSGDSFFNSGNLDQAMLSYRDAAMIFPKEIYPRNRVDLAFQMLISKELNKNFGQPSEDNFLKYLNYGDLKFSEREYTVAKVAYENALLIRPQEQIIMTKLQNANAEVQKMKDLSREEIIHKDKVYVSRTQKYHELVTTGDQIFRKQDIVGAKDLYAQAATQIEENSYALLMLQKIGDIISNDDLSLKLSRDRDEAEKKRLAGARNQAYNDAIREADRQFNQRLYRDALETYELALTIKNYEFYPKQQISDINNILAKLQIEGEGYNRLLREGEVLLNTKSYSHARTCFLQAHEMITDEKYALQKIDEIDKILEKMKQEGAFQEQYNKSITEADELFNSRKYNEAITFYQKASLFKPSENYPKEQIFIIRRILSSESNDQKHLLQQQTDYEQTVLLADNSFNKQMFQIARSHYLKALSIFPQQEYPASQIKKIDEILAALVKKQIPAKTKLEEIDFSNLENLNEEDRDAAFKEAMALGESFSKSQEWGVARFYFRRALSLYPTSVPASQKLAESERMISGNDVDESKYADMIKKADESIKTGDISVAKFYYSKALEAKPNDTYVKERIEVADQLLRSTSARSDNREFEDAMSKGDEAFNAKNFILARFFYRKALSIKSENQSTKEKINQTEKNLKQDKSDAGNLDFERNINMADQAFKLEKYGLAVNYYKQALAIKKGDSYSLGQLVKIDALMKK
jgi:tetratricopeptide (TPR) repeat protein